MARTRNEKLLSGMELFAGSTTREIAVIASLCTEVTFTAGDHLMVQGRRAQEFFAIVSGEAEVIKNGVSTASVTAGSPVGEMAMIDQTLRSATVTATSEVRALVLSKQEFTSARHASAGFDAALHSVLERRVRGNASMSTTGAVQELHALAA